MLDHKGRGYLNCSKAVVPVFIALCSLPPFQPLVQAEDNGPGLAHLANQFQFIPSLRFSASVTIKRTAQVTAIPADSEDDGACFCPMFRPRQGPILGQFEFWATGDQYRTNCYVDPERYPGMQTQVAYNGQKFQLLLSNGTLARSSSDSAAAVPILPNPLISLLQFRFPITDANAQYETRFKEVLTDQVPAGFFDATWVQITESGQSLERAIFPGGTYEGKDYVHQVFVNPGARNKPVRIERVATTGRMTSTEFTDYSQLDTVEGPTFWPMNVVMRVYDASNAEFATVAFHLVDISIDPEDLSDAFLIPVASAQRIWGNELSAFVSD